MKLYTETPSLHAEGLKVYALPYGVKHIVLNRTSVRNALNLKVFIELKQILDHLCTLDPDNMRLVLITGEGTHFSAGADLNDMKAQSEQTQEENFKSALQMSETFYALAQFPAPVVCAVQGAALGGGLGIVCCCDYVIAEETAVFATTEVRLGIVPGVISPYVLRKLGFAHGTRLMLTGERLKSTECLAMGLVQRVCAPGCLEETIGVTIKELLSGGPSALRRTKQLIKYFLPLPTPLQQQYTAQQISEARASPEGKEGIKAFLNKSLALWCKDLSL
jgi:methylglutaconyl-CoA hydratase